MLPVVKSIGKAVWPTTYDENEGHDQETHDRDDLDSRETEFGFTVDGDSENVQANDQDDNERDPCRDIDAFRTIPILNDEGRS